MREKFIRAASLLLAMLLLAALLPMPTARAAEEDLSAIVERQIRAYADSIDQRNADDDAAWALADHGINGGGKKLSVGASHPLTATLMNSELLQAHLIKYVPMAIEAMQELDWSDFFGYGCVYWSDPSNCKIYLKAYEIENSKESAKRLIDFPMSVYSGLFNSYDDSLEWIGGTVAVYVTLRRIRVTESEVTYSATVRAADRFDFSTANTAGFKKLLSGLGAILFREFDWEAKASFEITVPYQCSHSSGSYHWTYDAENHTFHADTSEGLIVNNTEQMSFEDSAGAVSYYHKLDTPVRLLHEKPWEVEFTTEKPWYYYTLSPVNTTAAALPALGGKSHYELYIQNQKWINLTEEQAKELGTSTAYYQHHYGTQLSSLFEYQSGRTYTFHLKNVISPDGSNMIWLTVRDNKLDEEVLCAPLDDHSAKASWEDEFVLQDESSDWVNGKDIYINYFGNQTLRFLLSQFDLRVWENGEGGESYDYFETKTVKPTCTAEGYTAHTCSACGYSYKTDIVPATDHKYKATVTPPTCTEEGYTTYTCSACKDSYTGDTVKALKHSYAAGYCARCGDDTVTAAIVDGALDLRATRGIKAGTWVLLYGYAADGRMMGCTAFLWDGTPQSIDLPAGEDFTVFFVKEGIWAPLRTPVTPK